MNASGRKSEKPLSHKCLALGINIFHSSLLGEPIQQQMVITVRNAISLSSIHA